MSLGDEARFRTGVISDRNICRPVAVWEHLPARAVRAGGWARAYRRLAAFHLLLSVAHLGEIAYAEAGFARDITLKLMPVLRRSRQQSASIAIHAPWSVWRDTRRRSTRLG